MNSSDVKAVLKAIKNSIYLYSYDKIFLSYYLTDIKNGERNNDFYDEEFLLTMLKEFATGEIEIDREKDSAETKLEEIIDNVKFLLPAGTETPGYEAVKNLIIVGSFNLDKTLFSLFDNKIDYQQVMNMIKDTSYGEIIKEYAIRVSPYCQNEKELKNELLLFKSALDNYVGEDVSECLKDCLDEAKKRVGIYPVDEKTLALISHEVKRMQSLSVKFDDIDKRIKSFEDKIKTIINKATKDLETQAVNSSEELKNKINESKDEIISELNDYLVLLEQKLEASSDEVFKQILVDAQNKINSIKILAQNLGHTTTQDLMKIKKASEESVEKLKGYVESEPQLQEFLRDAADSELVKKAIIAYDEGNKKNNVIVTPSNGIVIPGNDRIVVPVNPAVIIPEENVNNKILNAFDESIPFNKRFERILNEKEKREKNGEIFHDMTDEVIKCIIEGDWVYLWGPSGCGKSYLIKQVAKLLGIEIAENGKITDKYSIMAYNDPHGRFRATQAFVALYYGKLLSLDEFDNGNTDTQVVLNELYSGLLDVLEKPDQKRYVTFAEDMTVPINPNFRMISAGNTACEGENPIFSARGKIDESVQQRMIPKRFDYDNKVEKIIFGKYDNWYKLFTNFREACSLYAKNESLSFPPGMITTRDAAAIVKYINHNSKSVDQIIREKFTQTKDENYLRVISDYIQKAYGVENIKTNPINVENSNLSKVDSKTLAKCLVYGCNDAMKKSR